MSKMTALLSVKSSNKGFIVRLKFLSRSKNAILISRWFPGALHAEKIEIFCCLDCHLAAPIAFFNGSLLPKTFKRVSIIYDYC